MNTDRTSGESAKDPLGPDQLSEEELRALVRATYSVSETDRPSLDDSTCPSPEQWHELAAGFLDESPVDSPDHEVRDSKELARMLRAHSQGCARCTAELQLAQIFVEEARSAAAESTAVGEGALTQRIERNERRRVVALEERRARRTGGAGAQQDSEVDERHSMPPSPRGVPRGWLAAAAVVLAIAATFSLRESRAPQVRAPGSGGVVRGVGIEAVSPRGDLAEIPSVWTWVDHSGADRYVMALERLDGTVVFSKETSETSVILDRDERALLQRGVRYRWSVRGLDARGEPMLAGTEGDALSSETIDFRVER